LDQRLNTDVFQLWRVLGLDSITFAELSLKTFCLLTSCLVLLFVASPSLRAKELGIDKPKPADNAAVPAPQASGAAVPNDDEKTLGDYVPCLMDRKTLYAMRGSVAPSGKVDPNTPVAPNAARSIIVQSSKLFTNPDSKKQYQSEADKKVDALAQAGQLTDANSSLVAVRTALSIACASVGPTVGPLRAQ
jgi:hypothetical protein